MSVKVLFIGDPHFKVDNIPEVEMFIDNIESLAKNKKPDFIVIAGDLLHTHERLHTIALNKAYDFIDKMRTISPSYVLVGNHDMCNNSQFLTENHWMNGLKKWKNVFIIDKTFLLTINNLKFIFVPYVPNGRFIEALDTLKEEWKDVNCIFAHQEFKGCKMGSIISVEGDEWNINYPNVISGHIHSKQNPQENIYYPGSAMQHAFGESEKNIIASLEFKNDTNNYNLEEVDLKLPRKKIVYMKTEDLESYTIPKTKDKIKITISGNYQEFKTLKKTKKYKTLIKEGVKVVFKPKKIETNEKQEEKMVDFKKILNDLVEKENNKYLVEAFNLIIK